jgi:hypothetical protein
MKKLVLLFILFIANYWLLGWTNVTMGNWDLASSGFSIKVSDISPWWKNIEGTNVENWFLGTIIQNMMVALGVISILIMIIGAWFMIFHNWDDSLLSKWKTTFTWWIYAVVVALSSYYIISIVRYLLYNITD